MSYFEPNDYIKPEEYKNGERQRLDESKLKVDELYSAALKTHGKGERFTTLRIAARVLDIAPLPGLYMVRLELLDGDLAPYTDRNVNMSNGYITDIDEPLLVVCPDRTTDAVKTGYVMGYDDGYEGWLGELVTSEKLPALV